MNVAPVENPVKNLWTETASQFLPQSITLAVDTEFQGPHTLTVQIAARVRPGTLVVQIYRSADIPDPPSDLDLNSYVPLSDDSYGRFCKKIILNPVKPLTSDLSPVQMVRDLVGLRDLTSLSRLDGEELMKRFGDPAIDPSCIEPPPNVSRSRYGWKVPELCLTLVGHYLNADLCRLFGQDFLDGIRKLNRTVRGGVVIRHRKLLKFAEEGKKVREPVIEYCRHGTELHGLRVKTRDTRLPFESASLDRLSHTFLGFGKNESLTEADKREMLRTFCERPADAYGYAVVDAVNTLLVFEQMRARDRAIYKAFDFDYCDIPPLRATLGSRVSTFLQRTTERDVAHSTNLLKRRALEALMRKGGAGLFEEHPGLSQYGAQTGRVHGGLLFSRSPTQFWHAAAKMMRDVDMAGCYQRVLSGMSVYWGRPVVFEPGDSPMTLRQAVEMVSANANEDGWMIRVSGEITAAYNALIPSTEDAITSANYRTKTSKGKRRQAKQRAFHLEALNDPASIKGTMGSRLYSGRIESGVVTNTTWLMVQAMPSGLREQYELLTADSIIFYPRAFVADDAEQFDSRVDGLRHDGLPWEMAIDLKGRELVRRDKLDADYVSLRYPLGEFAQQIGEFRQQAKQEKGRGCGEELTWKVHVNSMYGVLACADLRANNFVAANQITAKGRALAGAMSQALNAFQTITDGCTYRLDQIPDCTFEECLRIKPDYPINRAEKDDGIRFIDPKKIPTDDAGFTAWYREHVKRFFGVSGPEYDALFGTHDLEHKKTGNSGSVAFDALACDGCGNYAKCVREETGWKVEEFKARSYGKKCNWPSRKWPFHPAGPSPTLVG